MILVTTLHPVIRHPEVPAGVGQMLGCGDIKTTSRHANLVRDLAGRVNSSCNAKTGRPHQLPQ